MICASGVPFRRVVNIGTKISTITAVATNLLVGLIPARSLSDCKRLSSDCIKDEKDKTL
jgi:hypothetical protein